VVPRFRNVRVRGLDLEGRDRIVEGEDLLARVLQHEMDHLEGILFITKVGPVDRAALKPKLKEMKAKAR
jgi:peptide deformylase